MSRKADYTADEWALLITTTELVGLRMLSASRSGPIGKLRELFALSMCMTPRATPAQFVRNELVLSLLEDIHEASAEPLTLHDVNRLVTALATARLRTLTYCEEVAVLLADRTPWAEADGVKRWLLWVASSVARASGDGWLGLGRKVSAEEVVLLSQIATSLHISAVGTIPTMFDLEAVQAAKGGAGSGDGRDHR